MRVGPLLQARGSQEKRGSWGWGPKAPSSWEEGNPQINYSKCDTGSDTCGKEKPLDGAGGVCLCVGVIHQEIREGLMKG